MKPRPSNFMRGVARAVGNAIAGCVFAGCAASMHSPAAQSRGYILVGVRGAAATGLAAGDTAFELNAKRVPDVLRTATTPFVADDGFDAKCSRYFAARGRSLVLLNRFCGRETAAVFDARILVIFDEGQKHPRKYVWRSPEDFVGPVPSSR